MRRLPHPSLLARCTRWIDLQLWSRFGHGAQLRPLSSSRSTWLTTLLAAIGITVSR